MPKALFKPLALTWVLLAIVATATPGCEEPTDPSLVPPEVEAPAESTASPATAPAGAGGSSAAAPVTPRTPAEHRKAAEAGDVSSMLLLGRSHESLGQRAEARKWYQRAADAGSADGKQALAQLDAPPPPATTTPATRDATAAATSPADPALTGDSGSAAAALRGPSTRRIPVAPLAPGDPGKLRWGDVGAILNYEDMISDGRMIAVDPKFTGGTTRKEMFIGRTSARDGSIVVAAMGPSEGDLNEVTIVIRVRNRVDPGSSPRVAQASAVTARVTNDNVNQNEFLQWVTQYLQTEKRSEPIFRAGWRISVSGSAAEGRRDPKPHLGTAVMIEMKK